jgi:hypothetical protein
MVDTSTNLAATSLIFSILSFILLTITLIMWQFPDVGNTIRSVFNIGSPSTTYASNFSLLFVLLGALSPDIILLVGFVSDILNGSFRFSVTSLVGVLAVVLHWIIGKIFIGYKTTSVTEVIDIAAGRDVMTGGAVSFNPCTIRGLGMFEVAGSPMGMAAISSVFVIYLFDTIAKRTTTQIGLYIGFAAFVFALNLYTYKETKCVADVSITGLLKGIALPTVIGLASGGIAYGVMKANYPEFLPLDKEVYDGTPGKIHAKCGMPSDNEFVCDAYKDGKKISTAVVA